MQFKHQVRSYHISIVKIIAERVNLIMHGCIGTVDLHKQNMKTVTKSSFK